MAHPRPGAWTAQQPPALMHLLSRALQRCLHAVLGTTCSANNACGATCAPAQRSGKLPQARRLQRSRPESWAAAVQETAVKGNPKLSGACCKGNQTAQYHATPWHVSAVRQESPQQVCSGQGAGRSSRAGRPERVGTEPACGGRLQPPIPAWQPRVHPSALPAAPQALRPAHSRLPAALPSPSNQTSQSGVMQQARRRLASARDGTRMRASWGHRGADQLCSQEDRKHCHIPRQLAKRACGTPFRIVGAHPRKGRGKQAQRCLTSRALDPTSQSTVSSSLVSNAQQHLTASAGSPRTRRAPLLSGLALRPF